MKLSPRRALLGATALLAVTLGIAASTTGASAALSPRPVSLPHVTALQAGPAVLTTLLPQSYGGGDADVQLQALRDQTSFRFAVRWDVSGAPARDLLSQLGDAFSDFPGFVPDTNSSSFAASTRDNKTYTVEISGAYQRPGREKEVFKIGDNTLSVWVIGRDVTVQYNKEKPLKRTLDASDDPFDSFAFVILWDNGFHNWYDTYYADQVLTCTPYNDTVNDLSVDSCDFNVTTKDQVADLIAPFYGKSITKIDDAGADLYLANDLTGAQGAPVELKLQISGKDEKNKAAKLNFSLDITDLNKKSVTVDAGK